jgi:hypothetical protein
MTKYLLYLYQCDKCSKPKKCELRIFGSSAMEAAENEWEARREARE